MATIPNDPNFGNQWYLRNTTVGWFDLNIVDVWDDYTGDGVQVAVIDGGFDITHEDLAANYLATIDYDYDAGDFAPLPGSGNNRYDHHGTPVMGIIGAANNAVGGVGVAWDVDLVGYRGFNDIPNALLDGAGIGDGIGNTNGNAHGSDIISMSFGRGSNTMIQDPDRIAAAEDASEQGRGGLGTIMVKSSGNSRAPQNDADREEGTLEALDSTRYTINVAAVRQDGWVTDFSTPGANVLVSAFADDTNNASAIFNTDITGADGYRNPGNYTPTFGGTSAAAPQVSGIVALMLEANDALGWRDVQEILAMTARHVGSNVGANANSGAPANGGFEQGTETNGAGHTWFWNDAETWNGGAMHFSNDYGYGLVDAKGAVRLAETWEKQQTSANDASTFEDVDGTNVTTALNSVMTTFLKTETTNIEVEHVRLDVVFDRLDDQEDLEIFLTSPDGTRVQLVNDTGDDRSFSGTWQFGTTAFMGTQSAGQWRVEIRNDDGSGAGQIVIGDIDLRTYGSAVTDDDLFVFTNEYSRWDGLAGHGTSFAGGAGTDTINAAAVDDSATILDFRAGTGRIDNVAITMSSIEKAFTGDRNDTIVSGASLDFVSTGRGNDVFDHGPTRYDGAVWEAGRGIDTLDFDQFNGDYVVDLEDGTFIRGAIVSTSFSDVENVRAGNGDDVLRHDRGSVNDLRAGGGDDTFEMLGRGFQTGDAFRGEGGVDTLDFSQFTGSYMLDLVSSSNNWTTLRTTATVNGVERVLAGAGDDKITLSKPFLTSTVFAAAEFVDAGAGEDTIVGLNQGVEVEGGTGVDLLDLSGRTLDAEVDLGAGTARSGSVVAQIGGIENVTTGLGDDTVTTNGEQNDVDLGDGDDELRVRTYDTGESHDGGAGRDLLDFSTFVSSYEVDLSAARFKRIGDTETNTVGGFEDVTAGLGNDDLRGNGSANVLRGMAGDDTLRPFGTGDTFDGGEGTDTFDFSSFLSNYVVDLVGGTFDAVSGSFESTLISIERILAGAGNDVFEMSVAAPGGSAIEFIDGGDGDDTFKSLNDAAELVGGDDIDTLDLSVAAVDVEVDLAAGTAGFAGQDAIISEIENVTTGAGDDRVTLDAEVNTVFTGLGEDTVVYAPNTYNGGETIDAGKGRDLLDFSVFNDSYIVDLVAGTIESALSNVMNSVLNFEDLLAGNGGDAVTGTGGANFLSGGNGRDTLSGGAGEDVLEGGNGVDSLEGGSDADTFVHRDGDGDDVIVDFAIATGDVLDVADHGVGYGDLGFTSTAQGLRIDLPSGSVLLEGVTEDMLPRSAFEGLLADAVLETGTLNLKSAAQTISLSRSYENPVALAWVATENGPDPVAVRLEQVSGDAVTLRLQEPNNEDGGHGPETVNWMVVEAGTWMLANGTILEAGTLESDKLTSEGFEQVAFDGAFDDAPVVLSQVQTDAGPDFVVTRQDATTADGFAISMQEEEAGNSGAHATETLGWVAIEAGSGSGGAFEWAAGTADGVTDAQFDVDVFPPWLGDPRAIASLSSFNGADPAWARGDGMSLGSFTVSVEEDTSANPETGHVGETVSYFATNGSGLLRAAERRDILETGTLTLDTSVQEVTLGRAFENPVAVAWVATENGADPVNVRIDAVSSGSFELRLQEPNNENGVHIGETVNWMVAEAGSWILPDGSLMEAGTLVSKKLSTAGFEQVSFGSGFETAPVILSQVQTENGIDFVTTRQKDADALGFDITMQEEQAGNGGGHAFETLGWIAFEEGSGAADSFDWVAGRTGGVDDAGADIDLSSALDGDARAIAQLSSFAGPDPAWARGDGASGGVFRVSAEEDRSADAETNHVAETVDYFAFDGTGILSGYENIVLA